MSKNREYGMLPERKIIRNADGRIRIALLGATGSVGLSTLNVIRRHPDRFKVTVLTANRSVGDLSRQVEEFRPSHVVVTDESAFADCSDNGPDWVGGRQALIRAVSRPDVDLVVNALVGFAGLEPSLAALEAGKRLALANKETLVAGADLIRRAMARGKSGDLVPIDSEHSAILQCLEGSSTGTVARLVLTASGGPFREWEQGRLDDVRPLDALEHPTWDMGAKITVDSATLSNKALEVIEAHVLYGCSYDDIEVVIHPQSIIHSLVEFVDGSVVAQLGFPDMELPILYALTYPERVPDPALRTFDPVRSSPLTFEAPDHERFPLLRIGVRSGRMGGTAPAVFNAANEVAVSAFLEEEISFPEIAAVVGEVLTRTSLRPVVGLDDLLEADREARRVASEVVLRHGPVMPGSNE